jgi:leader peptidase (prepilin peptidase)/N-methyltransferase
LLAAGGAWVGAAALPDVVLLAGVTGIGMIGVLRLTGRAWPRGRELPFGPALALAIFVLRLTTP